MIRDDDWVQVAMENDVVVVELLIQLQQASPPPTTMITDSLPLESWSVRQPRSKPIPLNSINTNHNKDQPLPPLTRSSPTTPLSWSGGATANSLSGGSGSVEESNRRKSPPTKKPDAPRSKVSGTITFKRPRKKKTLAELKEDEMLLMKEQKHLKKELEVLRLNLENQRAINQNYKRLKIDKQTAAKTNDEPNQNVVSCLLSGSSGDRDVDTLSKNGFSLPDLNIAFEEEI